MSPPVFWGERDGVPYPFDGESTEWFAHVEERRRVAEDVIGEHRVSTIFTGFSTASDERDERPRCYETMIFPECEMRWRYPTRAVALQRHQEIVAQLRAGGMAGVLLGLGT